jgi:hypothetical protein
VANREWAIRHNVEDAFRRFEGEVGDRLALALDETLGVMRVTVARHRLLSYEIVEVVKRSRAGLDAIDDVLAALIGLKEQRA